MKRLNNPDMPSLVDIEYNTSGNRTADTRYIHKTLGIDKNHPDTDLHHRDIETVQVVPSPIHRNTPHNGGISQSKSSALKSVGQTLLHITPLGFFIEYIWSGKLP